MTAAISAHIIALLFGASLVAGCVDAIAGGGGLITVPALLLLPISPVQALATNKLQGTVGTFAAAAMMRRHGMLSPRAQVWPALGAFVGAMLGSLTVPLLPRGGIDIAIPVILGVVALYFAFAPSAALIERRARLGAASFAGLVAPAIGFYDGFLGPGTGSFLALSGVALRGQDLIRATGAAKALNCASNLGALIVFLLAGKIIWPLGLAMVLGQVAGAALGARLVVRRGAGLIRPVVVVVCLAMLARYLWQKEVVAS